MSNQLGEEIAYIQGKAYSEGLKTVGKGIAWMLEKLLAKAAEKNQKVKAGECNLTDLIDSKNGLNQIKLDEKHLKDLVKEAKKYATPVAVLKTINDEYKVLFKSEDTEIVNSIVQDLITKQLKENTRVVDGITITKSNDNEKISFKDAEGKEFTGSIKDKQGVVKGVQDNLDLKPRKALELYIEATKVDVKDINATKLKSKNKITFKDGTGREYSAKLDGNKDTIVKNLSKTFGLTEKEAAKLHQKAVKQSIRSKMSEITTKQKTMQPQREPKAKNQDKGAR